MNTVRKVGSEISAVSSNISLRKFLKIFVNYCVLPVLSSKSGCKNLSSLLSVSLMGGTKKCIGRWQCSFVDILAVCIERRASLGAVEGERQQMMSKKKYSEVCLHCNFQKKEKLFRLSTGSRRKHKPKQKPNKERVKTWERRGGICQSLRNPAPSAQVGKFRILNDGVVDI